MINYIRGKLAEKHPAHLVIEANGIGYDIAVSLSTSDLVGSVGDNVKVFVYQHVREDSLDLFGFFTRAEKHLFLLLISVGGVGPKSALNVLSTMSIIDFQQAILKEDVGRLTCVTGIGKKTAQRMILELKDKVSFDDLMTQKETSLKRVDMNVHEDAVEALTALGYSPQSARQEVGRVQRETGVSCTTEELIRKVLKR